MILKANLAELGDGAPTVVEGSTLLPNSLAQYCVDTKNVVYLVATKDFQIQHFSHRKDLIDMVLRQCKAPEIAFRNWMQRDYELGKRIAQMAENCGYPVITVDGAASIEENLHLLSEHFGLQ